MPNHLLKVQSHLKALAIEAKLKASQFPNIFRFITEKVSAYDKYIKIAKLSLSGIISILFLILTISQGLQLQNNLRQEKKLAQERKNIENEIIYWEKTVERYKNYSDIYLKIASLEYRLGKSQTAQAFIEKALAVNPDTEQGIVLGERISRQ